MWKEFLEREGIFYCKELKRDALSVWDERKFLQMEEKIGEVKSAVIFLIPYYAGQKTTNLSIYAQPRDYHLYIRQLSQRFALFLEERGEDLAFCGFADSSPIAERDAALRAGLGFLGKNGLVINERYGSYFFIGEFFLNRAIRPEKEAQISSCPDCGACTKACPTGAISDPQRRECLSLISQKKVLTPREEALLDAAECKWGCDLCQSACPFNDSPDHTPIPFFREGQVSRLSAEVIEGPKEIFLTRAFSWRGRKILRRNLKK